MRRVSRSIGLCFYWILVRHVGDIVTSPEDDLVTTNHPNHDEHNLALLENLMKLAVKRTSSQKDEAGVLPVDALRGMFSECVLGLSFPCIQKKLIAFWHALDKMKSVYLMDKSILIMRKNTLPPDSKTLMTRATYHVDQTYLKDIVSTLIDKFFDNHSFRLKIPEYSEDAGDLDEDDIYLDIDFGAGRSSASSRRSRVVKKPGKLKGLKKLMMMVGLMTCAKSSMTLMTGLALLVGLKALKALLLAVVSLTMSKLMMASKLNLRAIFEGHDGHMPSVSHSSGWDRHVVEAVPPSTSVLPHNIEHPGVYNSYTMRLP